jgi:MFS family permease
MLDISKRPYLKYLLFGDIYFANGVQGSLAIVIIVLYFTEKDISIATTTMVAGAASLPFTFKFLFGPITDYFIKRGRKPFIIFGGLLAGITLFPLAIIDPAKSLLPFTIFLFLGVVGIVILDVCADAWAIQVTETHEHGKINAAMFGSMFGGMAIASIFLSQIAYYYNYNIVFIIAGSIILLTIILPLLVKEEIIVKQRPKTGKLLLQEFRKKNTIVISLFGFVAAMNFGMLLFIMPEFMMNVLKLNIGQIGFITSLYPIGIVVGSVIAGFTSDIFGRKKTLAVSLIATMIFTPLIITANHWSTMAFYYPLIGMLQGGATFSALMALFMDITNPKIGATQYSILTSITNFGDYSIAIFSGFLLMILGYQRFFLYAAWIVGPALIVLYFIKEIKQ